jgi:hypothetical protein
MSLAALQNIDESAANIGLNTALAALPDDVNADEAALYTARQVFPESEGWHDHYVRTFEVIQGFPIEPHQLWWELRDG